MRTKKKTKRRKCRTARQEFAEYVAPPLSLLNSERGKGRAENTKAQAQAIKRTLQNFKVEVEVEEVIVGPSIHPLCRASR